MKARQLTTELLLAELAARGLDVTPNVIRQDVKEGYLPKPSEECRGGNRTGRVWEDWEIHRAYYLYRLRRRGVEGQLLKVLLFVRDGWGWSDIQPICRAGLLKAMRIETKPVREHLRHNLNPENVGFIADEYAKEEYDIEPNTAKFSLGMGLFGSPIKGGSIGRLLGGLYWLGTGSKPSEEEKTLLRLVQAIIAQSGISWDGMLETVDHASETQAKFACQMFGEAAWSLRALLHSHNRRNGIKASTNILTLWGQSGKQLSLGFRDLPQRITPAQLLAACIGPLLYFVCNPLSLLVAMAIDMLGIPELIKENRTP